MAQSTKEKSKRYTNEFDLGTDEGIIGYAAASASDWSNYYKHNIDRGHQMRQFVYDDDGQWDMNTRADREARQLTCTTHNLTRMYSRQAVAEMYQGNPDVEITASNDQVPTEVVQAKIGIHREIVYRSEAHST